MLTVATRNMVDAQWSEPGDLARGTSAFAPLAFEVAAIGALCHYATSEPAF